MSAVKDRSKKTVYYWLNNYNKQDPNFTFSSRRNGSKGAASDYFNSLNVFNVG
jgi:hypothetical protein